MYTTSSPPPCSQDNDILLKIYFLGSQADLAAPKEKENVGVISWRMYVSRRALSDDEATSGLLRESTVVVFSVMVVFEQTELEKRACQQGVLFSMMTIYISHFFFFSNIFLV